MEISPIAKELVLVGGGHTHVIVLRMLGMNPIPGLQVTLITPGAKTPYSGMLPGVVAGHYEEDDIHIDLVPLCRFAGARFFQSQVTGIDPDNRLLQCEGRPDVSYDVLSIDIGITPAVNGVDGAIGNIIPVKPIDQFLDKWKPFLERTLNNEVKEIGFVGAGAGGVELCLAVHHRLQTEFSHRDRQNPTKFHLFHDGQEILKEYTPSVQGRFQARLAERDIKIWSDFKVNKIVSKTLFSDDGEEASMDEIFWVTEAAPQAWLAETGLKLDDAGFIAVRETLQSASHEDVFAVGDIAHVIQHPRPKAGVYAVRQGPPLAANLQRVLLGRKPKAFKPQLEFLSLISTGGKSAVGHRNGRSVEGAWVWRCKDWIDRRFMNRFSDLPEMNVRAESGLLSEFDDQMQCGGCGAKVSAGLLNEVLDELGVAHHGLRKRDDAAVYSVPAGKLMLHSVDSFRSFVDDPFVFAQIAVNHALSDIYAMGGKPVTALAVVTVPFARPPITKTLLQQLLAGAIKQLNIDGVELVGGHTSEGLELSLGFSVNGIVDKVELLTKSGMSDDYVLVLTKALGTGALFAADMQHKAKGNWINQALAMMQQSNFRAVQILRNNKVTACTDVTGFGLAGHLSEMVHASGCGVILDLDKIPALDGALEVINGMDITSTLHDGNRLAVSSIAVNKHEKYELLFDPQTSGGLLASVPKRSAVTCVAQLLEAGYTSAAIIGSVDSGSQEITFRVKSHIVSH
ncbi:MAG: selenide, water dikinase SelD [Gammaproteobacteria bacterium]|nr:selenide, water dikinase SelD [Gammaproteobacteria bacterium]